jgi:hypothetical protein
MQDARSETRLASRKDQPLWMPGEFVTQNGHTVDGAAGVKVLLKFLGCCAEVHLYMKQIIGLQRDRLSYISHENGSEIGFFLADGSCAAEITSISKISISLTSTIYGILLFLLHFPQLCIFFLHLTNFPFQSFYFLA